MAGDSHHPEGVPGSIAEDFRADRMSVDEEALVNFGRFSLESGISLPFQTSPNTGYNTARQSNQSVQSLLGDKAKLTGGQFDKLRRLHSSLLTVKSYQENEEEENSAANNRESNTISETETPLVSARGSLNSNVGAGQKISTKSTRQRRGAERRGSNNPNRVNTETVEAKRSSGVPGHHRFGRNSHVHAAESGADHSSLFRERTMEALHAIGGRLAAEHEVELSLVIQRSEWFEKELGLVFWELERICEEQGHPPPVQHACPKHLSVAHLKNVVSQTAARKAAKRKNETLKAGAGHADVFKTNESRGSELISPSPSLNKNKEKSRRGSAQSARSSVASEIYCDPVDGAVEESDGLLPEPAPPSAEVDVQELKSFDAAEEKKPNEGSWKAQPPPPQEHNPPPPLLEDDKRWSDATGSKSMGVGEGSIGLCPTLIVNEQEVKLPPRTPRTAGSCVSEHDGDNSTSCRDSKISFGPLESKVSFAEESAGLFSAPTSAFFSNITVTTPDNNLLSPNCSIRKSRISWIDADGNIQLGGDFDIHQETDNSSDEHHFKMSKVWQDKVNKNRPSGRVSQRSRGSSRRVSEVNFTNHSTTTRGNDFDEDSESDEDQVLLDQVALFQPPPGVRLQSGDSHSERVILAEKLYDRRWNLRLRRLVIDPESYLRTVVDLLGAGFVAYESIAIPMQFFFAKSFFLFLMEWVVRAFWTIELIMSMVTSYTRPNGKAEKRMDRVIRRYVTTWFAFDLAMVLLDWASLAFVYDGLIAIGRIVKCIRLMRTVRLIRMMRLHRLPEVVKAVAYYFRSDMCLIIMSIIRLIIFIIWINHVCCCCWFGIGNSSNGDNWIVYLELEGEDVWYQYWTSFHWSLAQFAAGSVEVIPRNLFERIYAVAALLFAYVVSAWIVSSITSSMTRLEIAAAQESQKMMTLKQYLFDNNISRPVALRVQRNAKNALAEKTKRRDESAVELLSMISEPLRMDMHFQINAKWLCFHPLFRNICVVTPGIMRQICHQALSRVELSKGDMLFTDDEPCVHPSMYFLLSGRMSFLHGLAASPKGVSAGHWACEATLWTDWIHCGDMRATAAQSTLLVLDAVAFQTVMSHNETQWMPCFKYATYFIKHLNMTTEENLTDLVDQDMDMESWVAEAIPDAQLHQSNHAHDLFKGLKRSPTRKRLSQIVVSAAKGSTHSLNILPGLG